MRVHFLSRRKYRAHCFLHPTRVFSREVRQAGIQTRVFYRHDDPRLARCDVLAVVCDYWNTGDLTRNPEPTVDLLSKLGKQVRTLVWCDITDDNGHLFAPAFARVHLYLKNQALRDRQLYTASFRERSYHGEYYHRNFAEQLSAVQPGSKVPVQRALEPDEIAKLHVSWNVGLGDYRSLWGHARRLLPYWPIARHARPVRSARETERPIAMSCRVGTQYVLPSVTFHRREAARLIEELADRTQISIRCRGWLKRRDYMKELADSEICVSPFGYGELCWRDFEAFLAGALLVKPDMDHLETWPNYFVKDVTYVAHRWDFGDFQEKLLELAKQPERCRSLATTAQDRYLTSLSDEGARSFAAHFAELMRRALARSESAGSVPGPR